MMFVPSLRRRPLLFLLFWLITVLVLFVYCQEEECSLDDKTCVDSTRDVFGFPKSKWCFDELEQCPEWASMGKCLTDKKKMTRFCHLSCNITCGDSIEEALEFLGNDSEPQTHLDDDKVVEVVRETVAYLRDFILDNQDKAEFEFLKRSCVHNHVLCSWWTAEGYCNKTPDRLAKMCPLACQQCHVGSFDLEEFTSVEYWMDVAKSANANLHIEQKGTSGIKAATQSEEQTETLRNKMIRDGYVQLQNWSTTTDSMLLEDTMVEFQKIIEELSYKRKLLPQLLLVYDEVWEVVNALVTALEPVFGLTLAHDFYIFDVKPGHEGTFMHRDRSHADWKVQFQKDEPYVDQPVYTTVWLALTNANQSTSNMFILPAYADYDYKSDSTDPNFSQQDEDIEDVLYFRYRNIRPLPVTKGTVLAWSHRALHWSSASPPTAPHSRQTLTFAMAKPKVEAPMIKHSDKSVPPPFEARVVVIVYCAISYHYQFYAQEPDMLLKFLHILTNPSFANHLSDDALSPESSRTLGQQFLDTLESFYKDEDLSDLLSEHIEKLARYIIVDRGLEGSHFLYNLVVESLEQTQEAAAEEL